MKICFVSGHYAPFAGGVETHIERIAFHLANQGDDVTVLTQSDDSQLPQEELIDGVRVRRFAVPLPSRHFAVSPALLRSLNAERGNWDVVHAHGYHSAAPLLAALARARPLVVTPHYHGTGHSAFRKGLHVPYRIIGSRIVAAASAVICVSEAEQSLFLSHFPTAASKTTVIPNGVDLDRLLAASPRPNEGRLIMSAGRLETYKHVDQTINAFAHLNAKYRLVVTGDGPDRRRLESIASELGLSDKIGFLGRIDVEDLYRWFRSADVYVSMSTNEAMPVTILELLACGARVVASDIPAHRNLKDHFGDWITVVPITASSQLLASEIEAAAESDRHGAPDVPTWESVTAQTRLVYEGVLRHA
jgi:glycosyltransferase involved in cell wall biosynthesis